MAYTVERTSVADSLGRKLYTRNATHRFEFACPAGCDISVTRETRTELEEAKIAAAVGIEAMAW